MERISTIYVLVDPRKPNEYRYVGKTVALLATRLKNHVSEAKRHRDNTYKNNWVRKLLRDNTIPDIVPLEQVSVTKDSKREIYWIAKFKKEGYRLTNGTKGGEGTLGRVWSAETKRKQSERMKGKLKGEKHPNYGKRGLGTPMYGKTHTEESKHKMSVSTSGKNNPMYGKGETRKGEKNTFFGKKHSLKSRQQMSKNRTGEKNHMYGKRPWNYGKKPWNYGKKLHQGRWID